TRESLYAHIQELLAANELGDAYIRLSVSAGAGPLGLPSEPYTDPTMIVYMKELPHIEEELYRSGKPLQLLKLRRNTPEADVRYKSFHYMNNILAKRECNAYPWAANAEGLFLTDDGHVAEGIVSNVFMVRGGDCFTPSVEAGILPGITRAYVKQLCSETGLRCHEGLYSLGDLVEAEELFLTNSIQEIVPVRLL